GEHAELASATWRRFGKGNHAAALDLGDCYSYALSKATGFPLLYKARDFPRTAVPSALWRWLSPTAPTRSARPRHRKPEGMVVLLPDDVRQLLELDEDLAWLAAGVRSHDAKSLQRVHQLAGSRMPNGQAALQA